MSIRKYKYPGILLALLVSAVLTINIHAASKPMTGTASLKRFFNDITTYEAKFEQTVLDQSLNVMQESSGILYIKRPDKFYWDYSVPFAQKIIGDGRRIWVYDAELQQATVRNLEGGLGKTPAILLAGQGKLEENFTLKDLGLQGKLHWVEMTPKEEDGGFDAIRIGFDNNILHVLEMVDTFDHTTRVVLSNVKENPAISENKFNFKPPVGTDVISQ